MTARSFYCTISHLLEVRMPKLSIAKKKLVEKMVKERIFKEATLLLQQERPQLFTMEELASHSDLAKGTLYNYFKNKQDVVEFVATTNSDKVLVDLKKIHHDNLPDYHLILRKFLQIFLCNMGKYRYMNTAILAFTYESVKVGQKLKYYAFPQVSIRPYMKDFFAEGIKAGAFKPVSPAALALFFGSAVRGLNLALTLNSNISPQLKSQMEKDVETLILSAICLD